MIYRTLITAAASCMLVAGCTTTDYAANDAPKSTATVEVAETTSEATETDEMQVASAESEVDDDRVICKQKIVTGSRFKKRLCMTWGEWKAQEQGARTATGDMQRNVSNGGIGQN